MFDVLSRAYHSWDLSRKVRRFGWTAIYVGDYVNAPTWAYTIGFHASLGMPEIIVFDIPMASANGLFHTVYEELKSGKLVIRDQEPWRPDELEKPVVWRKVHAHRLYDRDSENPWLGLSEDFARRFSPNTGPISAFQLVMSDNAGRLPWEPEYDERLRPLQRELYLPAEGSADPGRNQPP